MSETQVVCRMSKFFLIPNTTISRACRQIKAPSSIMAERGVKKKEYYLLLNNYNKFLKCTKESQR
jgi:hypothetical protein